MSDDSPDRSEDQDTQAIRSLRRIAATLGLSEMDFHEGSAAQTDLDDACEMMRIWDSLRHRADRQQVLAFARAVAMERMSGRHG